MPTTPVENATSVLRTENMLTQLAYSEQQRLDGYKETVKSALSWKAAFDRRVLAKYPGHVSFPVGSLVQICRSDLDNTFKLERKLATKWSKPHRITKRLQNSYQVERLNGTPVDGSFTARQLRQFIPREGMELAVQQKKWESEQEGGEMAEWEEEEANSQLEEADEGLTGSGVDIEGEPG